jgi:hypothetical protein
MVWMSVRVEAAVVPQAVAAGWTPAELRRAARRALITADLITDPGKPVPRLVGVEISAILAFESGSGWPLKNSPSRPFPGQINPGKTTITYGTSGHRIGTNYVDLGLRISYAYGGHTRTVAMWAPGVTCVSTAAQVSRHHQDSSCDGEGDAALEAADKAAS